MKSPITLFASICLAITSNAQGDFDPINLQVTPPSPNAASLGKYGDMPVSYYTGTPSISIPLYTIQQHDIEVPIGISYHGSGIKVEEIASWVGLGWSLNAGGAITRTVHGYPDESQSGFLNTSVTPQDVMNASQFDQRAYYDQITNSGLDLEPDVYYYNFNGRSGRMHVNKVDSVITGHAIPHNDLKITKPEGSGWIILDEQGVRYEFVDTDVTLSESGSGHSSSVTAWYLKRITTLAGDTVTFNYTSYDMFYCQKSSETSFYLPVALDCPNKNFQRSFSSLTVHGSKLASITYNGGTVLFTTQTNDRQDIIGDKALEFVEIRNKGDETLQKWKLSYSYFSSAGAISPDYCLEQPGQNSRGPRLKLESIGGVTAGAAIPPYVFKYNDTNLPERLSNAQDHWGYYNGVTTNNSLVPQMLYQRNNVEGFIMLDGADRNADEDKMKAASLEQITYPTGGRTTFDFEPHQARVLKKYLYKYDVQLNNHTYASVNSFGPAHVDAANFDVDLQFRPDGAPALGGQFTLIVNGPPGTSCNSNSRDGGCGALISIYNRITNEGAASLTGTLVNGHGEFDVFLANGQYRLEIEIYDEQSTYAHSFSAKVDGPDDGESLDIQWNKTFGGLRIARISNYDDMSNPEVATDVRIFKYIDPDHEDQSSGRPVSEPAYAFRFNQRCDYVGRSAVSKILLGSTSGSFIGYKYVQVYHGENGENGRELFHYTSPDDHGDEIYPDFPFPPSNNLDFKRGLMMDTEISGKSSIGFYPIQKIITNNVIDVPSQFEQIGLKAGCDNAGLSGCGIPEFIWYRTTSNWVYQDNSTEISFTTTGSQMTKLTTTEFSPDLKHYQKVKQITVNSDLTTLATVFKYGPDYRPEAGTFIPKMNELNVLIPVEVQQWQNEKLMNGIITEFDQNTMLPLNQHHIETTVPIADFVQTKTNGFYDLVIPDSRHYKKFITISARDTHGNVSESIDNSGVRKATLWDTSDQVIAEAANTAVTDIFFSSFEEGADVGDSNDSYTGFKSRTTGFTKNLSGLKSGKYFLSYWKKEPNWTLHKDVIKITGTTYSISLSGQVDEVRFYPITSMMKTYTYFDKVGLSTSTDEKDLTTRFEYDPYRRLRTVSDKDKNILQRLTYHYKYGID